ncbi:MAG TPA: hypothetical protein VEA37_04260 [Flavobacterium sp.]|nr:hypothetical protein [Flavobacterium sp.]
METKKCEKCSTDLPTAFPKETLCSSCAGENFREEMEQKLYFSENGATYKYVEYDLGGRKKHFKEYTMYDPAISNHMEVIDNGYKCKECDERVPLGGSCRSGCSNKPENLIIDIIQRPKSIHAVISKFKNGQERMRTSALFNQTIHELAHGKDPIAIIDQLITINESTQEAYQRCVIATPLYTSYSAPEAPDVTEDYKNHFTSKDAGVDVNNPNNPPKPEL